ncbi:MAG: proline--tRNA ligase [Chloroflexi bacterium]|nr:proline--tRNA ligase [Chloroflexota bacterium]
MRFTQLFGRSLRSEPEAETPSHRLLLKAGMLQQVAAGVYSYMPLAWRALRKVENIIRQEMDAAGAQELKLPALQPLELWQQSGRAEAFGQNLLRLKDRRERDLVIAPTHEETVTLLARQFVQSYRDLPVTVYQIQTKFRDEPRPRGGLIRVREFDMKDAYSFDANSDGLDRSYEAMVKAYKSIFARCGVRAVMVEADSGAIGGKDSHEFVLPTEVGEDTVILCGGCGYAANAERAQSVKREAGGGSFQPVEEVATPGVKTIDALAAYLGVPKDKTLKAVFYSADGQMVLVTLRGDLEVNEVKLKRRLNCNDLRLATNDEVAAAGLVAGYASPVGLKGVRMLVDDSIHLGSNFVAGANRPSYHLRNVNPSRDFLAHGIEIGDIALAQGGDGCTRCGTSLQALKGIEVGHVFKLGTFFSELLGAYFLDREGRQRPLIMGCYGIGVGRLLAAAIEGNHDERGICFPPAIAPYQVYLAALNVEDAKVAEGAGHLYEDLQRAGVEVLYDDRGESAGVKLNDADLLGFPVRVVVSPRTLKQNSAEVKPRREQAAALVPLDTVVDMVVGRVRALLEVPRP